MIPIHSSLRMISSIIWLQYSILVGDLPMQPVYLAGLITSMFGLHDEWILADKPVSSNGNRENHESQCNYESSITVGSDECIFTGKIGISNISKLGRHHSRVASCQICWRERDYHSTLLVG